MLSVVAKVMSFIQVPLGKVARRPLRIEPGLAGSTMTMADLAAAAQISVADYLGGIDWNGHEQTKAWYAMFKSRPSFRPLLSERMEVITPPKHYEQVDF